MNKPLIISYGAAGHLARVAATRTQSWPEYAKALSIAEIGTDKSARGWSCPAAFSPAYRDSENFVARHALTFDYDHVTDVDLETIRRAYDTFEYFAYTTFSHTADKPRWRFTFPLSRPATYDEFQAVSRKVAEWAGIELAARESHVPAQMMFLPVVRTHELFQKRHNAGEWIDVDAVLDSYANWTDRAQWPHRRDADGVHEHGEVIDPTTKPGVVGDFCRAYLVPAAIEKFELPYVYVSGDRWTYTAGSRPEGAIVYDNGQKLHSHHDSDPAHGQHNAFDLVRMHRFSGLDTEGLLDLPVTERPSFKEMARLASEDPAVQRQAARDAFEDLGPLAVEVPAAAVSVGMARPLSVVLSMRTQPRWLIRDELERGVMALMAGPRGSYKSFKALHWAMTASMQGFPVYVVSAEGGDFERRAAAWMLYHNVTVPPQLYVVERRLDLNTKAGVESIRADCLTLGIRPALFVLDTFSKLSGGLDENDNSQVKAFIGRLDNGLKRPDAFDATVLLVAHTGHSDNSRARGASALEADTDAAYIVQRDAGTGTVRISRERFKSSGELPPLVYAPRVVDLNRVDDDGLPVTSLILEPVDGRSAPSGAKPTGKNAKHIWKVLGELAPAGATVGVEALLDEAVVRLPWDKKTRDTRRQMCRQALQSLVMSSTVHLHGDKVGTSPVSISEDWLDG